MVTYDLFVARRWRTQRCGGYARRTTTARLQRNIASATGREDYVQVRLQRASDATLEAIPVFANRI
jgi:molybdopterin biosynthesis enzyme